MATLYLVISPNGNIAYAGSDAARAEFYRPGGVPSIYDTAVYQGYELFTVEADTPWLNEREDKQRNAKARKNDPA